jgi:iron complex outermembrane receptor protein
MRYKHTDNAAHDVSRARLAAAICIAIEPDAVRAGRSARRRPKAEERRRRVLDTITVTAQKRTENLQEVPISVQVLGNQKLTKS